MVKGTRALPAACSVASRRAAVLSGAYEGRVAGHFPDGHPPLATDLDLPLYSFRMDEIRAALLCAELSGLDDRLARFHANYDYLAAGLRDVAGIAVRTSSPVLPAPASITALSW